MTEREYNGIVSKFKDANLAIATYPQTRLINAEDCDGITQSYYASTGTAIFRMSNDKFDNRRITLKNMAVDEFIDYCANYYSDEIFKELGGNE